VRLTSVFVRSCIYAAFAGVVPAVAVAQGPSPGDRERRTGVLRQEEDALPGCTLFAPLMNNVIYLVDMQGNVVQEWHSDYPSVGSVDLEDNGHLLRCSRVKDNPRFRSGGDSGRIEEIARDSSVVWAYEYSSKDHMHHHDVCRMRNGNLLFAAWEKKTREEAIAAGRDPRLIGQEFWPDHVIELRPERPQGGTIVWEWHMFDHLVQDFDPTKANYGDVASHPERIDINADRPRERMSDEERQRLEELGYIPAVDETAGKSPDSEAEPDKSGAGSATNAPPPPPPPVPNVNGDWTHLNSIDYHEDLDQIVLSSPNLCELYVIDHSTTTEEARGHQGGRSGNGGDILYRWGNPSNYRMGTVADRKLFAQHNVHWIAEGMEGEGHLLLFNNGAGRPEGAFSTILEIETPIDENGRYLRESGRRFGPESPAWEFVPLAEENLFSSFISGTQRLENGNTLICSGEQGRFVEVSYECDIVWEYVNPFLGDPNRNIFANQANASAGADDAASEPDEAAAQDASKSAVAPPRPDVFAGGPFAGLVGQNAARQPNAVFRALRIPSDHPGLRALLDR